MIHVNSVEPIEQHMIHSQPNIDPDLLNSERDKYIVQLVVIICQYTSIGKNKVYTNPSVAYTHIPPTTNKQKKKRKTILSIVESVRKMLNDPSQRVYDNQGQLDTSAYLSANQQQFEINNTDQ